SGINVLRELTRHFASQRKSEQPVIMPVVFTSALPLGDIDKDEFESLGDESLLSQYDEGSSISQTPQVWIDHVASEEEGHILLSWDSLEGLFPANMIEDMFAQYESLVRQLAQDDQVWQQLRLDLLPQEQKMLRDTKNQTEHPMPQKTALGFYLQNVEKQPSAAAILGQQYKISYAELHRYVMVWSRWLRAKGVGKGDYVGIIMEKDWQEPVAVLAVNLAGAAYVPINAHWPQARQISIIESIDLSIILTQPQCAAGVEALGEHILGVIDEQHNIASEQENDELDWSLPGVGDCSHVIFTSGSSGLPKGVSISHGAMANTVFEIVDRFRLKPKDRILALSAITFDLSVLDMFAAFSSGAGLVVPLEKMRRDSQALNALLDQHQVSMVNAVPALVAALIDQRELTKQELPKSLRLFIMGGDFIPVSLPDRIRKLASDEIVIMSMGGPTETVIYSIGYEIGEVDAAWPSIPYGSAMRNRKCWVVDDLLNDRPEGVPGEIITGGHGVLADGYWANEELTAEKFATHPDTGEPIFKTGDLGLYLPSGEIRILGRRDFQVKINGFRVELSEIERLLSCHESVKQAIVNAQRSDQMASSLIAYVVPRDGVLLKDIQAELSALCKENLPEYMAPHVFVELDSLPLSANGKVDRNALPEHVVEHIQREHVAARNETEQVLLEIWQELLSDPKMGIHDNFFDQGGHSLIAMQMQTRIRSALVKECTIGVIFSHPSVVELAQFLESETNVKADLTPLEKAPEGRLQRPSFAQQRLWFIDQLDKHTEGYHSAYNMPIIWKIEGDLNAAYMRKALEHVIDRHSVLRTVFNNEEGRAFTEQIVSYELPWRTVDLSAVKQSDIISETWQTIQNEVERPFDLSRAPLVRGLLLTQSKIVSYLVITMHHIVTDAWSIALMNEELLSAYQTLQEGLVLVAEPPAWEYADFAHWQHDVWQTEQMQVYEDYWLNRMDPLPEPLKLPTDFSVPLQKNYLGVALPFTLDAEEVASIDLLASEFQLTTFIALMSAFSILLSRYTNQNDIVIGTDVANRFPAQTENMLGYFINQIALRVDVSQGDSVEAFLDQLRQSILQDIEHEHMPLDRLIDRLALARDLSSTPLFQVKLNYHSVVDADLEYSELNIENQAYDFSAIQYDLVMTFKREGEQIAGTLQYRKELFAESSMVRLIEHFRTLVLALGVAEDWPKPVQRLVMQRPEQLAQQLELARASTRFPLSLSDSPDADKPV
ncbi:MAG: amino acid adenylation domain-containing protein, partial [Arenicella sp.]|nr:amino acid adenylation domain-containing protein [Arenicella sp.]